MERCSTKTERRHRDDRSEEPIDARELEQEFERLYLQSYPSVYGYVRARMSSDVEAEDVVAEAYLRAARAFANFDPTRAAFGTWVTTIAKNCMVSFYRKERPSVALEDAPETVFAVPGGQEGVDDLMYAKQLLGCLEDDERELIAMKYRDGMRNVDIARELEMNPSTVSTKLANALAKMRAHAEREG